ncbi:MAG: hypothetical protein ACFB0B_01245 [Thermonemataceae bacterium]
MELVFSYVNDKTNHNERIFIKGEDITNIQTYKKFIKKDIVPLILISTKSSDQPLVLDFSTVDERDAFFEQLISDFSPNVHEIKWRWGMI